MRVANRSRGGKRGGFFLLSPLETPISLFHFVIPFFLPRRHRRRFSLNAIPLPRANMTNELADFQ